MKAKGIKDLNFGYHEKLRNELNLA